MATGSDLTQTLLLILAQLDWFSQAIHDEINYDITKLSLLMAAVIAILVWATALLDKTILLILALALLAPRGRFVPSSILFLVALFFGLVNRLRIVLGGAVYRHKLERLGLGGVDELVLRASRNNDDIRSLDILVFSGYRSFSGPVSKDQHLVDRVHLLRINTLWYGWFRSWTMITSSPISPPIGISMVTNWLYRPVWMTFRN